MRFCDLMSVEGDSLNPVEQQKMRGEMFEIEIASISQNRMQLWKINQAIITTGKRFLLGVCPSWNFYDLYLLDCINDVLKTKSESSIFEVLNLDVIKDLTELQTIFGEIIPQQEPVLGVWENGVLLRSLCGWEAKNFLIDKYKFVWSPLEDDYIKLRDAKIFNR